MFKTIASSDSAEFDKMVNKAEKDGFGIVGYSSATSQDSRDTYVVYSALMHKSEPNIHGLPMSAAENINARISARATASASKPNFPCTPGTTPATGQIAVRLEPKIENINLNKSEMLKTIEADLREEARQHGVGQ
ncbi:MAG: hypothetical protein PWQ08_1100 [Clostridiales bacterium]|jgi:hypothetical protein|nr:hypothetical protein [Clostridiales bacterium]